MANDAALTAEELALVGTPGEGDPGSGGWTDGIENEGLKAELSKFPTQEEFLEAVGFEAAGDDWRADLPDELKETAEKFASNADAIRAIEAFRKRDSLVRVPGKDATNEERAAYHKVIGVPETAAGYEYPDLPEGVELTDDVKASRAAWSERFHRLGVSKGVAKELSQALNDDFASLEAAHEKAEDDFLAVKEVELRSEWGDDYGKNMIFAKRAIEEVAKRAGMTLDDLREVKTEDGKQFLERTEISRLFAIVGREMSESTLGPVLTDSELEGIQEAVIALREKAAKASAEGNSKLANQFYAQEQALSAKQKGNAPIVGSEGRTA